MMHSVKSRVKSTIATSMFLDTVKLSDHLVENLGMDSLDYVSMRMAISEEFDTPYPIEGKWRTVQEVVDAMELMALTNPIGRITNAKQTLPLLR